MIKKTLPSKRGRNSWQERKGQGWVEPQKQRERKLIVAAEMGRKVQRTSHTLCCDEVIGDLNKPFQRSQGKDARLTIPLAQKGEWKLKT